MLYYAAEDAKIITLRAIALKQSSSFSVTQVRKGEDHNATSYSTETLTQDERNEFLNAKIITLRAIALKLWLLDALV